MECVQVKTQNGPWATYTAFLDPSFLSEMVTPNVVFAAFAGVLRFPSAALCSVGWPEPLAPAPPRRPAAPAAHHHC